MSIIGYVLLVLIQRTSITSLLHNIGKSLNARVIIPIILKLHFCSDGLFVILIASIVWYAFIQHRKGATRGISLTWVGLASAISACVVSPVGLTKLTAPITSLLLPGHVLFAHVLFTCVLSVLAFIAQSWCIIVAFLVVLSLGFQNRRRPISRKLLYIAYTFAASIVQFLALNSCEFKFKFSPRTRSVFCVERKPRT